MQGRMAGMMTIIFGCVAVVMCLIAYVIVVGQADTSMTSAATYTEMSGLTDSMGMGPMIIFMIFMFVGLGAIMGGAALNVKGALTGTGLDIGLSAIFGAVTLVIIFVFNNLILSNLHTAYLTVNATVNRAHFAGVLGTMGIFGLVIYWSLIAAGVAQIGAAGWSGFQKIKGTFSR